jgi:hypothetical protein
MVTKITRAKIALARTGTHHTDATKDKMRLARLAYWEEIRATNQELALAGFPIPKRHHSLETCQKIKLALKGRKPSPQALAALQDYLQERTENANLKHHLNKIKKGNE